MSTALSDFLALNLEGYSLVVSRHYTLYTLPSLPDVVLDAGSEGEGGALGLDVDCVGPRETLVTGGGLHGALIDEAGGLTLALWNTALC